MKKRVTIYVEEDVWKDIRVAALNSGESAGDYLVGFHESLVENTKPLKPSNYEHKDLVAEIPVEEIKDDFINALADEDADLEDEEIKQANERLMKKRIETKKGPVKANAAMESFFNPIPKAKWKGAK